MTVLWLLLLLFGNFPVVIVAKSTNVDEQTKNLWKTVAKKGIFFFHFLHFNAFFGDDKFRNSRDVFPVIKWSATVQGRPELPQWLHLLLSKHSQTAYLIGTPVTAANQVIIDIIARNENNFQHAQKLLLIDLISNGTHDSSTKRIAEIMIKNYDPEDFIFYSPNPVFLRNRLISAIQKFTKDNQTYIFNLLPAVTASPEMLLTMRRQKFGTIVQIGTQNERFHSKVENLAKGIEINPQHCKRAGAYQNDFLPEFDINWCKFTIKSITRLHSEIKSWQETTAEQPNASLSSEISVDKIERIPFTGNDDLSVTTRSSWDSFLMFPMLGVMCILFLILLSMVFFGRREGQYWRDYKTPKEQLEEYVNVRESQRHLRDLSLHRQILEPPPFDHVHSTTPLGVHSFLQLLQNDQSSQMPNEMQTSVTSSTSRERRYDDSLEHATVGKQTVAEAAKACGSSLHMYRNPFDQESNEDEDDEEVENESETGSENPSSPLKLH